MAVWFVQNSTSLARAVHMETAMAGCTGSMSQDDYKAAQTA